MLYRHEDVYEPEQGIKSARVYKNEIYQSGPCSNACGRKLVKRVKAGTGIKYEAIKPFVTILSLKI